jgi:hypothetical protein
MVHAIVSMFSQRGHWFPNEGDIEGFRANLRRACPRDESVVRSACNACVAVESSAVYLFNYVEGRAMRKSLGAALIFARFLLFHS